MTKVTDIYLILNGESVQNMQPKDEIIGLKIILK